MRFDNPVLRGFNPDPCLCRQWDTFYIATSTFEWFPGVQIFSSKDLQNWELINHPIDSKGIIAHVPESGGIWAPDLSFNEEEQKLYLAYTVVNHFEKASPTAQGFKDVHNYLITAASIEGPWSEPVYINSSGFDPSVFHEDGHSYFLNMLWNYREGENNFDGIAIQKLDDKTKKPIGTPIKIFEGTSLGTTEGPRIYKRGSWYYLVLAEGGTSYLHSVTIARSLSLFGPYETTAHTAPFLSQARDRSKVKASMNENPLGFCNEGLQKTGHASFAKLDGNKWLMAFLASRPEKDTARCPLGRETALATIEWGEDGWPYLDSDMKHNLQIGSPATSMWREDFDSCNLDKEIQFLRKNPLDKHAFTKPGFLLVRGGESPASINQNLLGKRITEMKWEAETCVDFDCDNYQQMAGLAIRYNESNQYYLAISTNRDGKRTIALHSFIQKLYRITDEKDCPEGQIIMRARCDGREISFSFKGTEEDQWIEMREKADFTLLSDDYYKPIGFTGAFACIACNDMCNQQKYAAFDYLSLKTFSD